jgi:hypothetical protein
MKIIGNIFNKEKLFKKKKKIFQNRKTNHFLKNLKIFH